jgi:hypothetical protein
MRDSGIEAMLGALRERLVMLRLARDVDPDGELRELAQVLRLKRGSRRGVVVTGA